MQSSFLITMSTRVTSKDSHTLKMMEAGISERLCTEFSQPTHIPQCWYMTKIQTSAVFEPWLGVG